MKMRKREREWRMEDGRRRDERCRRKKEKKKGT